MTIRVHFDGKVLIPVEPVDLPQDQVLEIEVREAAALPKGSAQLLLKIMSEAPHVAPDVVDEMERAIEESQIPVRYQGVFDAEE